MRPIVKQKNFLGFKIWLENLGYEVKQLDGGFVARAKSREAQRAYKKLHHYVRVGSDLSGNQAAYELGAEFENHLRAPEQTCTAKAEKEIMHIVKGESHGNCIDQFIASGGFDKAFNGVFGRSDDAVNAVGSGK